MSVATDPWIELGLVPGAGDEAIRAAYLDRIKQYPPDRAPAQFERARDAYEALRDPRRRAALVLTADEVSSSFVAWFDGVAPRRQHVGLELWLRAVSEK